MYLERSQTLDADKIPLTYQQGWVWQLRDEYSNWRCFVAHAFQLDGMLDVNALRRSCEEIVRRHGSLRFRVAIEKNAPSLYKHPSLAVSLEPQPIAGTDESQIELQSMRLLERCANRQLHPGGPLARFKLFRFTDNKHCLMVVIHRLVADCNSIEQLFRELWVTYADLHVGRPSPLQANVPQYSDYAVSQFQLRLDWQKKHGEYWTKRLADAKALSWPRGREYASTVQGTIGRVRCQLPEALTKEIHALGRDLRTLTANVMLAVFAAVLRFWCRQDDFIIPFKIAGRRAEHRSIVGNFTQILYLRVQLNGDETFAELVSNVGNEFFRALAHQDFGLMASQYPEFLHGTFFQWVTCQAQFVPSAAELSGLKVKRVTLAKFGEDHTAVPPGMVNVEMTFFDTPEGIYASGVYRADRFSPAVMEQFVADLRSAAEGFVRDPQALVVRTIPKLSDPGDVTAC